MIGMCLFEIDVMYVVEELNALDGVCSRKCLDIRRHS